MTHREYGPQGPAAARFLDALERLDTPEIVALGAAGGGEVGTDAQDPQVAARARLRLELREIARHAGRLDAVRAIGGEVEQWAGSAQHWFPAGVAGTSELASSIGPRLAALQVVLDAAYRARRARPRSRRRRCRCSRRRDRRQARHRPHLARERRDEAGPGRQPDLPDRQPEAASAAPSGRVVAERVLGLGHADRQVPEAQILVQLERLRGGGQRTSTPAAP
jgi:hypothetical protein